MNEISRKRIRVSSGGGRRTRTPEREHTGALTARFPFRILISPSLPSLCGVASLSGGKTEARRVRLSRKVPPCYVWCLRPRGAPTSPSFALSSSPQVAFQHFFPYLTHYLPGRLRPKRPSFQAARFNFKEIKSANENHVSRTEGKFTRSRPTSLDHSIYQLNCIAFLLFLKLPLVSLNEFMIRANCLTQFALVEHRGSHSFSFWESVGKRLVCPH